MRKVSPQEALDLQAMFPDIAVDFTQFKVISDNYTQSTKTSCDTLNDTRCEFYIPPKATIIKHWMIEADVKLIDQTGAVQAPANSIAICQTLDSAPSCIERFTMMHGNGSGEILSEITNHAHALFKMRMQGMKDASEYGYYICDDDYGSTAIVGADQSGEVKDTDTLTIALPAGDDNIPKEYFSQARKIQLERQQKYKHFG